MGALSNNFSCVVCSFTFCIYAVMFNPYSVGPWGSEGMPQGCVGGAERVRTERRAPVSLLVHPELLYVLDLPVIFPFGGRRGGNKFKNHQLHCSLVTSEWYGILSLPCSLLLNEFLGEADLKKSKFGFELLNMTLKWLKLSTTLVWRKSSCTITISIAVRSPPLPLQTQLETELRPGGTEGWQTPSKRCCSLWFTLGLGAFLENPNPHLLFWWREKE